jgi:replicative DNA helicase
MAELFSTKAEQAILGLIIDNPKLFSMVAGKLEADDFYDQNNKTLFIAIENSIKNHKSVDHVILIDELKRISTISQSD